MADASTSALAVHNIGVVQRRTGIKSDLVRAWERRYGAVVPQRTKTDRRLYSDADIRRLTLLRDLTRVGHRIGHIATLPDSELERLLRDAQPRPEPRPHPARPDDSEGFLPACMKAVHRLDAPGLSAELDRASFHLGRITLVETLLVPLMERVGALWLVGELDPAQEHLATATIRTFVGNFSSPLLSSEAPCLVATTPAGQKHELGALLAGAVAAAEGWQVVYLGADLPAPSIAHAAKRAGARAIALGITFADGSSHLVDEIEALCSSIGQVEVFVGGREARTLEALAETGRVTLVEGLDDFRGRLAASIERDRELAGAPE